MDYKLLSIYSNNSNVTKNGDIYNIIIIIERFIDSENDGRL